MTVRETFSRWTGGYHVPGYQDSMVEAVGSVLTRLEVSVMSGVATEEEKVVYRQLRDAYEKWWDRNERTFQMKVWKFFYEIKRAPILNKARRARRELWYRVRGLKSRE